MSRTRANKTQREEIAFSANFRRFTPGLFSRLTRISVALAKIEAADLWPAAAEQLRFSAKVGTVHYSNLIEGNELPVLEAERAARGALGPDTKAKIELVNYVDALNLIDRKHESGSDGLCPTPELLLEIHHEATKGLGVEDDPHFKPRHEGAWRDGVAKVVDRTTGQVMFTAPPAKEVEARVAGLSSWILSKERDLVETPAFVIAGAAHYGITDVHPFADGNGRAARLFTVALLLRYGVLPGRLFSFEEYYGRDTAAYYEALRSVRRNTLNMEAWLDYFLEGLALEYERVAMKVQELSALGRNANAGRVQLSEQQQAALTSLHVAGISEIARVDYERAARVSKAAANRDLARLVSAGVLARVGGGARSRYRFARAATGPAGAPTAGGRPRKWTEERIDHELRQLVGGRAEFPSVEEFRASDNMALYNAVVRNGGSRLWAERLGITASRRGSRPTAN